METSDISLNFIPTSSFNERIENLNGGVDVILDEFKRIYVLHRLYPANQEYQQQYTNLTASIDEISSRLFSIANDIDTNIYSLNQRLILLNNLIRTEREKNRDLKLQLGIIENQNNASTEMANDYRSIYSQRYLRNWGLGLSILLCVFAIGKVYNK